MHFLCAWLYMYAKAHGHGHAYYMCVYWHTWMWYHMSRHSHLHICFFSNGTLGRVEFYVQINTKYSVYMPKRHMIKFTAFHVDITGQVCHRTNIWWLVNCMEMHLKMLPAKCWPFSLGLNVLIDVCKMSFVSSTPLFQKRWFYLTWLFYNMLNLFILYVG